MEFITTTTPCSNVFIKTIFIIVVIFIGLIHGGRIDSNCKNTDTDCVCSMETFRDQLNQNILRYYHGVELEEKMKSYQCPNTYERLPRSLIIDASHLPIIDHETGGFKSEGDEFNKRRLRSRRLSVLSRKKRQALLGIPTDEVFNEAIAQLNPRAYHQYSVLGSSTQFSCVGPNVDELDEIESNSRRVFKWTHYNGAPITAPQSNVDRQTGILSLHSLQLSDTGIYNCTIEFNNEDGEIQYKNFSHQLSVISEPIFMLKFSLRYTTEECQRQEKLLISDHLIIWIQELICPYCQIHNASIHCTHGGQIEEPSREYEIGLVVSVAGLDLKFSKSHDYYNAIKSCSVSCLELYQAKILEVVRDSMIKLFSLPIEIMIGNGHPNILHTPIPGSIDMSLLLGCLAGFHLNYKLCFPCDIGHFSPDGNSNCFPCSIGYYQPLPGSSLCVPCGSDYKTTHTGSISQSDCILNTFADLTAIFIKYKLIIGVVFGFLIIIIMILVIIRCCCSSKTTLGKFVNGYCCCCCPAKDNYGYEDEVSMTERSRNKERRSPNVQYTKLTSEANKESSKRRDKNRKGGSINKLLDNTKAQTQIDMKQIKLRNRNKNSWRQGEQHEEEFGNQVKLIEASSLSSSDNSTLSDSTSADNTSASIRSIPVQRLGLHRCRIPTSTSPRPVLLNSFDLARANNYNNLVRPNTHETNSPKFTIPKPPPLPNFSY